jgi:hypothetical protein
MRRQEGRIAVRLVDRISPERRIDPVVRVAGRRA